MRLFAVMRFCYFEGAEMYELSWDNPNEIQKVTFVPVGDRFAEIDAEDWERVNRYRWGYYHDKETMYAHSGHMENGKWVTVTMHRLIMNPPTDRLTDHKNHNGLDNRKLNLRLATHSQNSQNRRTQHLNKTGYKGLYRNGGNQWAVKIGINGKKVYLGTFKTKEQAALAYNEAALEHFGEFACLNKIQ